MQKKLILFMPTIDVGGVEKNLFIISNYLSKKLPGSILITGRLSHSSHSSFGNFAIFIILHTQLGGALAGK